MDEGYSKKNIMIEEIYKDSLARMEKTKNSLKSTLANIRAGRAHPSLLEQIQVEYYGSMTALNNVANIVVEDARCLKVMPWEKNMVVVIEKAIMTSELGLNPNTDGQVIRIPLPPLTEDRRNELVKLIKDEGEKAKIAIRNIRRDSNSDFKDLLKDKQISQDKARVAEDKIQKITDGNIKDIGTIIVEKELQLQEI